MRIATKPVHSARRHVKRTLIFPPSSVLGFPTTIPTNRCGDALPSHQIAEKDQSAEDPGVPPTRLLKKMRPAGDRGRALTLLSSGCQGICKISCWKRRSSPASLEPRVEDIAERVSEEIPSQDEQEDRRPRNEERVPELQRVAGGAGDPVAREVDELAPVRVAWRGPEPEEGEHREG